MPLNYIVNYKRAIASNEEMYMRNLIFIEYPTSYWSDLLNSLHERLNFEVYFIKPQKIGFDFDVEKLERQANYRFHYLRKIKIFNRIINFGIYHLLKKNNPEYVITSEYSFITLFTIICRFIFRFKYKIIVRCDDSYDMVNNKRNFTFLHSLARAFLIPFVDNVILVEPRVVNWYQNKYNKGILFPIIRDEETFRNLLIDAIPYSNELIKRYDIEGKKVVAFVGRLVKIKNVDLIINAFQRLNNPDVVMLIIGDGPEYAYLYSTYSQSNVIFVGFKKGYELLSFYNIISVLMLLSDIEAFGAVTNEALLAGANAIVSERAGSSFLVEEPSNNVVDPYDCALVDEKLRRVLSDCRPISLMTDIRDNLMPFSYNNIIDDLVSSIKKI